MSMGAGSLPATGLSAVGPAMAERSPGRVLPRAGGPRRPPLGQPAAPEQKRRLGWVRNWRGVALGLSLLLHLAIGWWLLFGFERRVVQEPSAESTMEVVFEGGAAESTPAPPPGGELAPLEPPDPAEPPRPPEPMPRMAEPPGAAPSGGEPLAAPVPPPPAPAAPMPPVARAVPPPAPLPVQPAPSDLSMPPAPPPVEAPRPSEMAAIPPPPPSPPEPGPPEVVAARPPPPQRAPQPAPAPAPRARAAAPASPFAGALDLSQGPPVSLGRPAAPSRPSAAGPQREAAISTAPAAPDAPNAQLRIRGANLGADWRSAFMAWLRQHGYYPRQAAEAGEDGTAIVRFTVDRSGRVSGLQLIGRSGSIWLDAGAQALLRGRTVPPFPPSTPEDSAEIDLTINYILRR